MGNAAARPTLKPIGSIKQQASSRSRENRRSRRASGRREGVVYRLCNIAIFALEVAHAGGPPKTLHRGDPVQVVAMSLVSNVGAVCIMPAAGNARKQWATTSSGPVEIGFVDRHLNAEALPTGWRHAPTRGSGSCRRPLRGRRGRHAPDRDHSAASTRRGRGGAGTVSQATDGLWRVRSA